MKIGTDFQQIDIIDSTHRARATRVKSERDLLILHDSNYIFGFRGESCFRYLCLWLR